MNNKSGVIEIPLGKWFAGIRTNPWMPAAIVLALVLLGFFIFSGFDGGVTGNVVSEDVAGQNLLSFINAQGNGIATLKDVQQVDGVYQATVNYQGQDIPVYVSLDGQYLISDRIPLTDSAALNPGTANTAAGSGERVEVEVGDAPMLGNVNAFVTILEFTDFQCPYCERYYTQTYNQLKTEYIDTGKVKYYIKQYPLSFHPEAQKAAEASLCVREQKGDAGFFKMHDKMFENQATLSVVNEKKWARELGVDGTKFDTCLDSGKFASKVQEEESYGQSLGVSGTPGFFINGVIVEGAQPYSVFKQIIDSELENSIQE